MFLTVWIYLYVVSIKMQYTELIEALHLPCIKYRSVGGTRLIQTLHHCLFTG